MTKNNVYMIFHLYASLMCSIAVASIEVTHGIHLTLRVMLFILMIVNAIMLCVYVIASLEEIDNKPLSPSKS